MFGVLISAGMWLIRFLMPKFLLLTGSLAISAAVYTPLFNWVQGKISASLGGMGGEALQFLQFVGIPNAISIIFAAVTLKIGIKSIKSATAKSSLGGTDV